MNKTFPHDLATLISLVVDLMPQWPRSAVTIEAHLPGGYAHANYRIRVDDCRFALRTPGNLVEPADLAFEAQWLASLPADIGARTVAYDSVTGALLTAWIDAPLLAETQTSHTELVSYLVRLHDQLPKTARRYDVLARVDVWLAPLQLKGVQGQAVARARNRLSRHDFPMQTAHNDLNPWNILCATDGWRTLDWEWVGTNDPFFDLVTLGLGVKVDEPTLLEMAHHYADRTRLPIGGVADRLDHAICGFWLREYAWAEHEIRVGNSRPEVLAQRDHALTQLCQL
jgi:aminoglycoside phosphotransferase (APT) family kinase protein